MCTVPLPPSANPTAVNKNIVSYNIISYISYQLTPWSRILLQLVKKKKSYSSWNPCSQSLPLTVQKFFTRWQGYVTEKQCTWSDQGLTARMPLHPYFPGTVLVSGFKKICPSVPQNSVRNTEWISYGFPSHKNMTFLTMHTNILTFPWWAPHLTWQLVKPDRKDVGGGTVGRVRKDECCTVNISTYKSNFVMFSFLY